MDKSQKSLCLLFYLLEFKCSDWISLKVVKEILCKIRECNETRSAGSGWRLHASALRASGLVIRPNAATKSLLTPQLQSVHVINPPEWREPTSSCFFSPNCKVTLVLSERVGDRLNVCWVFFSPPGSWFFSSRLLARSCGRTIRMRNDREFWANLRGSNRGDS